MNKGFLFLSVLLVTLIAADVWAAAAEAVDVKPATTLASKDPAIKWEAASTLDVAAPQPASDLKPVTPPEAHPRIFVLPEPVERAATLPAKIDTPPPSQVVKAFEGPYEVLQPGWTVQKLAATGDLMDGQLLRPGQPTALGCFHGPQSEQMTIISSHATGFKAAEQIFAPSADLLFDSTAGEKGACTRLIVDAVSGKVLGQELSLAGTTANTAGARTPWGTFLSSERQLPSNTGSIDPNGPARHGYLFEVLPLVKGLSAPSPIPARGALSVGAVCFDKVAQVVYLGEDKEDGLLFRFTPNLWGELSHGGRMEVLAIEGFGSSLAESHLRATLGEKYSAFWIKLPGSSSAEDLHRLGLTAGGAKIGAIRGLAISGGRLCMSLPQASSDGQLLSLESDTLKVLSDPKGDEKAGPVSPGILFYTSKGELVVCESREIGSRLLFQEKNGAWMPLLRVSKGGISGADISADGRFIFVNLQELGQTLALRQAL